MMHDLRLARLLAMDRMPARYLGCDVRIEYARNFDGFMVMAIGMPVGEGVPVTMHELLLAQIAATPSDQPPAGPPGTK